MRQAGQAIGAAGEVGLIHRDIKPENLLLTRKGRVKVADFGLCRDLERTAMHVTQPGMTMGTPLYMSPEQAQGQPLDHRSDLYSLGVTFYHMLDGRAAVPGRLRRGPGAEARPRAPGRACASAGPRSPWSSTGWC